MEPNRRRQLLLCLIGGVGAALFAAFLAFTYATPRWVEDYAADFLAREVATKVDRAIDALAAPPTAQGRLARAAAALHARNEAGIAQRKEAIRAHARERIASEIARMRDPDCACLADWHRWLREGNAARIPALAQADAAITDFIRGSYARSVAELRQDLRVFSGSNLLAFLAVLAVALMKPKASAQLFVPALLLAAATVLCSYFYLFQQDWLLTLVFRDFLGYSYLAFLGLVFALLCDVVLNRARVTSLIANAVLDALGSAATVVPC